MRPRASARAAVVAWVFVGSIGAMVVQGHVGKAACNSPRDALDILYVIILVGAFSFAFASFMAGLRSARVAAVIGALGGFAALALLWYDLGRYDAHCSFM